MPEKNLNNVVQQLQRSLDQITGERVKVLENFRNMQVLHHVLLQQEERRLSRKLGSDHAKVKLLQRRLNHNQEIIKDLEVELEIAHIEVPTVNPKEALIHGRITDHNLRGISGLTVLMQDEGGKVIREVASSKTNTSGYYALKINSSAIEELTKKKYAYLAARTENGKAVFNDPNPLVISEGARIIEEVELNREDLRLVRVKRPDKQEEQEPAEDEQPPGSDVWKVRGRVADDNGQPIEGVTVSLYDKDFLFDDLLGNIETDKEGKFEFLYRSDDFLDLFEKRPDIYLKVLDKKGNILYSSKNMIRFNAGKIEEFNIKVKF